MVSKSNKSSVSNIFNNSNEIKDFPVKIQETLKRFVKKRAPDLNGVSDKQDHLIDLDHYDQNSQEFLGTLGSFQVTDPEQYRSVQAII